MAFKRSPALNAGDGPAVPGAARQTSRLLRAYANPAHEQALRRALAPRGRLGGRRHREVRSCKVPTVPDNRAQGVLDGLRALLRAGEACASLAHGTTTVTNAIVEGRVAPVGLVTTRGFRDVLEIARMNRAHLYRLELPARAEPLCLSRSTVSRRAPAPA